MRRRDWVAVATGLMLLVTVGWVAQSQTSSDARTSCPFGDWTRAADSWAGLPLVTDEKGRAAYADIVQPDQRPQGDEPVYFDVDGTGTVSAGDVRWSTGAATTMPAGSRVAAGDSDVGIPLTALELFLGYLDAHQDQAWTAGEPVLIDLDLDGNASQGDLYLSPPESAGSRVDTRQAGTAGASATLLSMTGRAAFLDWGRDGVRDGPDSLLLDADLDAVSGPQDLCLEGFATPQPTATSPRPSGTLSPTSPTPTKFNETTRPPETTATTLPTKDSAQDGGTVQQPGGFNQSADAFQGRYVRFVFDAETGRILNYSVSGLVFLESIDLPCPCAIDLVLDSYGRPTGAAVTAGAARLALHDQPNGLIRYTAGDQAPVAFYPASPFAASSAEAGTLRVDVDGRTAYLLAATNGAQASAAEGGLLVTSSGSFFVTDPIGLDPVFARNAQTVTDALVGRRLAAQVQVLVTERGTEPQILAYEDVTVSVERPDAERYVVRLDAEFETGRSFLFQFPDSALTAERLEIQYDAEIAPGQFQRRPIAPARDLADALDPHDEQVAEYWVESGPEGHQVAVSVPHFSVQIFQVLGIPPESAPLLAYGVVVVFIFLGLALVGVVVGRTYRPKWRPPRRQILPWPRRMPYQER